MKVSELRWGGGGLCVCVCVCVCVCLCACVWCVRVVLNEPAAIGMPGCLSLCVLVVLDVE